MMSGTHFVLVHLSSVISCYHCLTDGEFSDYSATLRDGLVDLKIAYLQVEIWFQQVHSSA